MLFLVDYNRRRGEIVSLRTFDASQQREAEAARLELELRSDRNRIEQEIVLLDAVDEQALRKTHRRYFANLAELAVLPETSNGSGGNSKSHR